ncbi:uncharacterized metal-dependent hydrolase TatD-like [Mytilus edulis]|uniref:uncharacterized metal-dependent hydrolase TatD-like n=1 Tax=Mytilus edulis TaxID=6550 RepID=UPI0039EE9919
MAAVCQLAWWEVPRTFTLSPINSPAVLMHWRAQVELMALLQGHQRQAFLGKVNLSSSEPSQASSSSEQGSPPAKAGVFSRLGAPVCTQGTPRPMGQVGAFSSTGPSPRSIPSLMSLPTRPVPSLMSLPRPGPSRSLPSLGSRGSSSSAGAQGSKHPGNPSGSRGVESQLCRDLPEAFDSHMHLDRSLTKMGLPSRTSLGDFLRVRLDPVPVDPVKLAGGVAVFCDPKTWPSVPLRLEPGWVGAVGIHPKSAGQFEDATQHRFHQLVSHPSVSALGEVGVDFTVEEKLHARQISTLRWALQSCRFDQPVVLHIRGGRLHRVHARAHREVLEVLKSGVVNPLQLIHLHCFQGGGIAQVREWQDSYRNAYFGFGMGVRSFNSEQKEALRSVPPYRILLESDAPYFFPPNARHGHPHYLYEVAKVVGTVRADSPREIVRVAHLNGSRLYGVNP